MSDAPVALRYEGAGEFRGAGIIWDRRCDSQFVIGEVYRMAPVEERSMRSHNHYFSCIAEAWKNLPEQYQDAPWAQSPEHFRKYLLIKAGYHDSRSIVAASKAEAQRIAAFVKPIDEFAVVVVSEATVTIYTAQSQAIKAMGKKVFGESKNAVLDLAAEMIGTTADELAAQGKAA